MKFLFWYDGQWLTENPKLLGPSDQGFWMASMVFDGARAFGGYAPDLELHCQRVVRSAKNMLLEPSITSDEIIALAQEGIKKFPHGSELYIKPMFFCDGFDLTPTQSTTHFVLQLSEEPLNSEVGFSACLSRYARPWPSMAPTDAKASCLYPNSLRVNKEARMQGFDTGVVLDGAGNVAEFAMSNLFVVDKDTVITPIHNGCFLNGLTRQRVLKLLKDDGIKIEERVLRPSDLFHMSEIFSTGNYSKVKHCHQFEDRSLPYGPIAKRALELYLNFAKTQPI